ncbi:Mal regulon transcriptional regulator MalI [Shigella dysenteriae]|uniref:Mal regulon transcriptional regulator MalI n=1 Tax=Shigella dysenteriae TaxID=622 RepID=UPI000E5D2F2B|nr:Mal regulon transcriptional regulator MalI [Shigella dysenteriae]RIH28416.1 Mal regulon transcriptional regulator MalI [Shigella dysenteriae]
MATAKKITIHDVALAAGVSVSTVSLVLSGKGRISTATGERVNAAIEELGFVRNRQASALRGGQSGVIDTVRPDNMQAAQLLTEHLIRNGHQRIAWLGGQSSSLTRAERVGGYCATLLKFGLPFHSDWVLECTSSQKQAAEAITALLRHNPTISAVVCYNETIAMGAWFGLLKAGRQSGESGVDRYFEQQVSLAAFTDATPTTLDDIPVTWASTPARELGTTLADRMMQKITHEETHSRNLIIPARLIAAK